MTRDAVYLRLTCFASSEVRIKYGNDLAVAGALYLAQRGRNAEAFLNLHLVIVFTMKTGFALGASHDYNHCIARRKITE